MSVTRFTAMGETIPISDGKWVRFEDYTLLKQQLAHLSDELARLKAENAVLAKDRERLDWIFKTVETKGLVFFEQMPWTCVYEDGPDSDFVFDRDAIDLASKSQTATTGET